jgi:hypothetical protein
VTKKKKESSFSEEKEAKRLLLLRRSQDPGHGRDLAAGAENKSLFSDLPVSTQ